MITQGVKAPDFSLPDQDGVIHSLKEYKGKWLLIYFYPKDNTPGCTKEACSLRDMFPNFRKNDMAVVGVSADSVASHKKFATAYELPFTLLADTQKEMINAYGVWQKKKFMGREYMGIVRSSFLIDPKGKIVKVYEKVKPEIHGKEVSEDLKQLTG